MEKASVFEVIKALEGAKVPFKLARNRPDTIRIDVTLYGLRLEVECFEDNHVEVSTFKGDEDIEGGFQYLLQILIENNSE